MHYHHNSNMAATTPLHQQIHAITDTEEHARDFLFQKSILRTTLTCSNCSGAMNLVPLYQMNYYRIILIISRLNLCISSN